MFQGHSHWVLIWTFEKILPKDDSVFRHRSIHFHKIIYRTLVLLKTVFTVAWTQRFDGMPMFKSSIARVLAFKTKVHVSVCKSSFHNTIFIQTTRHTVPAKATQKEESALKHVPSSRMDGREGHSKYVSAQQDFFCQSNRARLSL